MTITPPSLPSEDQHILTAIDGYAGVITLNRPKALNALSLSMIRDMSKALIDWKDDPNIHTVIIKSNSEKTFCAGGDVRAVYEMRFKGDAELMVNLFQEEYLLNYMISIYPKPYIALIDGIAMGGGLGISIHGSHRVVTERATLAMPETSIGFFPDVGASYFLNRCPGEIGTYIGVLGHNITAEDALYVGLATHRLSSTELGKIYTALTHAQSHDDVDDILQDAAGGQSDCLLQTQRNLIDRCFSFNTIEEIFEALQQESDPIVREWLKGSLKKSPMSLKLTLAILRKSKGMSLKDVLTLDFKISQRCLAGHDLIEGVRAVLIDKDHTPLWKPSRLEDVTQEMIESYFRKD
jgi:enoyl-CoA hydratase/carnithine racemase